MQKALLFIVVTLASHGVFAADKSKLIGTWVCHLASDSSSYDLTLDLSGNNQYIHKWEMQGDKHVEKGVWRTEGSMLVLSRKKYGKNEKEKDSAREFRRGIVALSDASLELRHEGALTKCKKKSEAPPKK